jgi:ribosomal protein S18 acetylase RimI-like enzyme
MPIEVRDAHASEYTALGALAVRAYRDLGGLPPDHPYYSKLADVAGRATDTVVLVARLDGTVAGVVTYVPGPDTSMSEFSDPEAAGMRALAVDPSRQRRGVGRALTAACIDLARTAGKRRLIVHSAQTQRGAQAMYRAMGFRRDPTLDWSPEPAVSLNGYVFELDR